MSNLYELVGEHLALQRKLEAMDLDQETIADTLDGNTGDIDKKVESYCCVIRNYEAAADAKSAEAARMMERAKADLKRAEKLKEFLFTSLQAANISKSESTLFTVTIQNNPSKVVIDDEALIPADYMRNKPVVQPPPEPDKDLIKKAIADGYEVAGAHIVQTQRLVIK